MLREFIRTLLNERIRQVEPRVRNFNLNEFKNLKTREECLAYAATTLEFLGKGSSRSVFLLTSNKALKIAISDHPVGKIQNENEIEIYTNPTTKNVIAKIYDYDKNFNWIMSELVRPLTMHKFKTHFGIKNGANVSLVREISDIINGYEPLEIAEEFTDIPEKQKELASFLQSVVDLQSSSGLDVGDLVIEHFGQTPTGRIVLYDYGLTEETAEKYY